jgi:hypothetical protein
MTPSDRLLIGELRGEVRALTDRVGRIEDKLDELLDRDRSSVVEFRIEDLDRQIREAQKARQSLRPREDKVRQSLVLWLLGAVAALATAIGGWFAAR